MVETLKKYIFLSIFGILRWGKSNGRKKIIFRIRILRVASCDQNEKNSKSKRKVRERG